jgi:transcription initiation factor TFIID subunit 6
MEEKSFAVLTKDSVRLMADAGGHSNVDDDVATLLGEDVSYRLREAVMKSAAYIRNAKRRQLCTSDFNQALRDMDVQPVYGQSSSDATRYRHVREGDFHFAEDPEVTFSNLVNNSYAPRSLGLTSVKGHWISTDSKTSSSARHTASRTSRHHRST